MVVSVFTLAQVARALACYEPRALPREGCAEASVALLLREGGAGLELLFIERAQREGDPWSGHMAFPGGGRDSRDRDVQHAAERETFEEVGISLREVDPMGRLDDLEGRHAGRVLPLVISAFVYAVDPAGAYVLNDEVREALWVRLDHLVDPQRQTEYVWRLPQRTLRFHGIRVGAPEPQIVWGLTYRFLESFFRALGTPLGARS